MPLRRIRARAAPLFLLAALCCMLVAACGGDDGDGGKKPSPAPMPSSIAPGSTMASIVQRGKLVVRYEVGGEEARTDQQHRNSRTFEVSPDLLPPLGPRFESRVIPDVNDVLAL